MQCPYCGAELTCIDYYGKTQYAKHYWESPHMTIVKIGDIYKCQNSYGFNTEEEALEYAKENNIENSNWQEIVCESDCFNGLFYTDSNGNLHEGYPC